MTLSRDGNATSDTQPLPTVLIVEDELADRSELREVLEADGYCVLEAEHGRDALRLLTSEGTPDPNLIVLDLNMPVMTGWEFLSIVKSYHRLAQIPVLVISGGQVHEEAIEHGAIAACLKKPFDCKQLLEHVKVTARRSAPPCG